MQDNITFPYFCKFFIHFTFKKTLKRNSEILELLQNLKSKFEENPTIDENDATEDVPPNIFCDARLCLL